MKRSSSFFFAWVTSIALTLVFSFDCFAKNVRLFRPPSIFEDAGIPVAVPDYAEQIRFLAPGDEIEFTNGKKIRIGKKLGSGGTSIIYESANDPSQAIRIPKNGETDKKFISFYLEGYKALAQEGVPVVRIHDGLPYEYVVVDRLPGRRLLTLSDWMEDPAIVSPSKASEMSEAFLAFSRKLAPFSAIGDFSSEQIAYDPGSRSWILFDWLHGHQSAVSKNEIGLSTWKASTPFNDYFFAPFLKRESADSPFQATSPEDKWLEVLANRAVDSVRDERKKLNLPKARLGQCLTSGIRALLGSPIKAPKTAQAR